MHASELGATEKIPDIGAALLPLWKDDEPGTPFVDGDIVDLPFGRRAMCSCLNGETITVNLPEITANSAARRCGVYDVTFAGKDYGTYDLVPQATNSVGGHPVGTTVHPVPDSMCPWFEMESDGSDTYNFPVGLFTEATFSALQP